jgi:hypothetical protein
MDGIFDFHHTVSTSVGGPTKTKGKKIDAFSKSIKITRTLIFMFWIIFFLPSFERLLELDVVSKPVGSREKKHRYMWYLRLQQCRETIMSFLSATQLNCHRTNSIGGCVHEGLTTLFRYCILVGRRSKDCDFKHYLMLPDRVGFYHTEVQRIYLSN